MRALLACLLLALALPAQAEEAPRVLHLQHDGWMINAGTRDWVLEGLQAASDDPGVSAVLLELDTPGGQLEATREMVKAILASDTPVIVWVGPSGSRAASAGVFLTVSAHVAAMAPATHIGAAHPVMLAPSIPSTEPKSDEEEKDAQDSAAAMLDKITNDTVAWGRNLADLRGRNADWVESAVRESVSIGSEEALELRVIDFLADSPADAVALASGRTVTVAGVDVVLELEGATLEPFTMTLGQRFQLAVGNPTVLYLLLVLGLAGIWLEVQNPGLWVPGVLGAAALILAAFGIGALPVNAFAVLLIVLGFGLLVTEIYVPSLGVLTAGGVACVAAGGWFLVERSAEVPVGVSPAAIAAVSALILAVALIIGWMFLHDRQRQVVGGQEGMIGQEGVVVLAVPGGREPGRILVHGERWAARCEDTLKEGARVRVLVIDGLTLEVEPIERTQ